MKLQCICGLNWYSLMILMPRRNAGNGLPHDPTRLCREMTKKAFSFLLLHDPAAQPGPLSFKLSAHCLFHPMHTSPAHCRNSHCCPSKYRPALRASQHLKPWWQEPGLPSTGTTLASSNCLLTTEQNAQSSLPLGFLWQLPTEGA